MGSPSITAPKKRGERSRWSLLLIGLLCLCWVVIYRHSLPGWPSSFESQAYIDSEYKISAGTPDWRKMKASDKLQWQPCYRSLGDYYCARLTVPLDYNRSLKDCTEKQKVQIALVMLPGQNHSESNGWSESPILLNPGGPGGSGVELVLAVGRDIQNIAGNEHDIIGFDPRGIGKTTPTVDCFMPNTKSGQSDDTLRRTALLHRTTWEFSETEAGLPNSSDTATDKLIARTYGLNKLCSLQDHQDNIMSYAGTTNVAQDMLTIVHAWDQWTLNQPSPLNDDPEIAQPLKTRGKLVYWGFSYGTVLGATFATMFREFEGSCFRGQGS